MTSRWIPAISAGVLLAILGGCGSSPVYKKEEFNQDSPYQLPTSHTFDQACQAAQLALLSQGYQLQSTSTDAVHGQKNFQPDDEVNSTLDVIVTCRATSGGSTIFATAVKTTYELKKVSGNTGFSVSGTSITMPWSKTADSLVKVAGVTISDDSFYTRFFKLVSNYLPK